MLQENCVASGCCPSLEMFSSLVLIVQFSHQLDTPFTYMVYGLSIDYLNKTQVEAKCCVSMEWWWGLPRGL